MTDRSKLLALAEAVEKLSGPDRRLDCLIENELGLARFVEDRPAPFGGGWLDKRVDPKPYTASLDSAMTLVPEGWAIDRISMWPATPEGADNVTAAQSSVSMVGTSIERFGKRMVWGHGGSKDGKAEAKATTPALALTAACLRAQAEDLS